MLTVKHSYGVDLDWAKTFASAFGGHIEENFICVPEEINTGIRYFLETGDDILLLYIDVVYNKEVHLIQSHLKHDFIGLYFNLSIGKAVKSFIGTSYDVGQFGYDVCIIDSEIEADYEINAGAKSYGLYIFIKKSRVASFAKQSLSFSNNLDKIMDDSKNTFIKFDRMSLESFNTLTDLNKLEVGSKIFNLNLIAAAYKLISNYLYQMFNDKILIEKVNKYDLLSIIKIQALLFENSDKPFPSIKIMSDLAHMSETKFKILFKKITGTTPNDFYMINKLKKAKELLEIEGNTISEVTEMLNFTNYSYFIFKFKEHFGISPKTFIKKL